MGRVPTTEYPRFGKKNLIRFLCVIKSMLINSPFTFVGVHFRFWNPPFLITYEQLKEEVQKENLK